MSDLTQESELDLPPSTAPEHISVSLRGFADETTARQFGDVIASVTRLIGCRINLERLDGITVAFDYNDALAQLDRGYQATRPLMPTNNEELLGVAMTPTVMRDGIIKAHMVFYAAGVLPLEERQTDAFWLALYLVAHECGHVEDLLHRDQAFPNTLLRPYPSIESAKLGQPAGVLWEEYAACRISAVFGEKQTSMLADSLISVMALARNKANAAIRAYRTHGDVDRVLKEAGGHLCEPLRIAAYLLGNLDGLNLSLAAVPNAQALLAASEYRDLAERLHSVLKHLWSTRGNWASRNEFDPLNDIVRDVLRQGGMTLSLLPDGKVHVAIPFTSETMP